MGNYSLANIFSKEPVVIAGAVRSVLWVLVLLSIVVLDEKQLAGIGLALEVVLGLFARQASTSTAEPKLPVGTPVIVDRPAGSPQDVPPPDAVVALRSQVIPETPADLPGVTG